MVVAEDNGRIVGHYAVLPRKLKVGDRNISAGLVVDVMTHPKYGRRGLFVQAAIEAFSAAAEAGIELLVGFPNDAAIRGHRKVGWHELPDFRIYVCPIKISGLSNRHNASNRTLKFFSNIVDGFVRCILETMAGRVSSDYRVDATSKDEFLASDSAYERFIERAVPSSGISNARELEWMQWRFGDPLGSHEVLVVRRRDEDEIQGYAILKFKEIDGLRTCVIMDYLIERGDYRAHRELVRRVVRSAVTKDSDLCLFLGSLSSRNIPILTRTFFLPVPRRLRFIVRPTNHDLSLSEEELLSDWHIEAMDHDIF